MRYRFDVLGPLQVSVDGKPVELGSIKQRLLLASLLLRPNELVHTDELVALLWEHPPASAAANLRSYVRGLRRTFDTKPYQRLPIASGGYLLRVHPGERDVDEFEATAKRGRTALVGGDLARAEEELATALDIWRGNLLADLPLPPLLKSRVAPLEELRLLVEEDYAEAKLAAGAPHEVIHRLRALLEQHPLRQRAWRHLMVGLYRSGDVAGALAAFRHARQLLAEHLGLDPGPELIRLHDDILHHRPVGTDRESRLVVEARLATPAVRPEQLPLVAPDFVGRDEELARLDACLDELGGQPTTVIITAVSGMAGIGKTTLALWWAHRVAGRFPDGQLYTDLRGYDDVDAVPPADALRGFLEALGVAARRIPTELDARIGLYRSLLASRQMLIVLDNARDCEQVRPLLPGAGRCVVVVTSRDQLNGLVAAEGAKPITLGVLTSEESMSLLRRRIGEERLAAEPAAATSIIRATGGLPLALSIVAARAATKPTFPLGAFAAELTPFTATLDALADGDVRRVFSWSHRTLSPPAARLFRLLGLHPGPDLTRDAAAALLGTPPSAVIPLLRELTRRHLLTEHVPSRYTLHDLLRAYAAELVRSWEPESEQHAARQRLYDYYLPVPVTVESVRTPPTPWNRAFGPGRSRTADPAG